MRMGNALVKPASTSKAEIRGSGEIMKGLKVDVSLSRLRYLLTSIGVLNLQ